MLSEPNPALNEKEQALVNSAPEECLRHAVQRGALALDEALSNLWPNLSPRVAAVVQGIAAGERVSLPERQGPSTAIRDYEWTLNALGNFSQIGRLLSEQALTPDEAMEAAHAIDNILGRYLTGTKYAAP
jgi:hypothetical protein